MIGGRVDRTNRPWLEPHVGATCTPAPLLAASEPKCGADAAHSLCVHLTLRWSLPQPGPARLSVLDAAGRAVRTLCHGWMAAGEHSLVWDQRDDEGRRVYAGLYRVRFEAAGRSLVHQVMLLP